MNVYTYYDPYVQPDEESAKTQEELIKLWAESWAYHCWNPVVLNPTIARQHPMFEEFTNKVEKLPTVNNPRYEEACYHRWLAMAKIGGGLMTDYDVMNKLFLPHELSVYDTPAAVIVGNTQGSLCPCMVYGSALGYQNVAKLFMDYIPEPIDQYYGQPHVSDQNILQKLTTQSRAHGYILRKNWGQEYGDVNWNTAKTIHFPNGKMVGLQPRHEHIRRMKNEGLY